MSGRTIHGKKKEIVSKHLMKEDCGNGVGNRKGQMKLGRPAGSAGTE
jgi:hypothetical protein